LAANYLLLPGKRIAFPDIFHTKNQGLLFLFSEKNIQNTVKKIVGLGNAIPVLGVKLKRGLYVFWYFYNIGLCSATMEIARRGVSKFMSYLEK